MNRYDWHRDPVAVELVEDCAEEWGRNLALLQKLGFFPEDGEEAAEMMDAALDKRADMVYNDE